MGVGKTGENEPFVTVGPRGSALTELHNNAFGSRLWDRCAGTLQLFPVNFAPGE